MASTNGTIKRLVHDKGFGFIAASDGSEYFFHQSSCQTPFDELREGQAVTFEKGQGPKGPRGENVKLAIELADVRFTYPGRSRPALDRVAQPWTHRARSRRWRG